MTLLEQGEMERDLAARFKIAQEAGRSVAEWVETANAGLDAWERSHPQRGTRIAGFSESGKQVFEKRRT